MEDAEDEMEVSDEEDPTQRLPFELKPRTH